MTKSVVRFGFIAALLALGFHPVPALAQAPVATRDPQLVDSARKLFQAIADSNVDTVRALTEKKYGRRITRESISFVATGPKLKAAFDGKVEVVRNDGKYAVVSAPIFTPDSAEVPKAEVSRLTIFMEKDGGGWKAESPNKKDAGADATLDGGWYHPGSFTWCPKKGFEYLPNHFSNKLHCRAIVACERF